MPQTKKKPAKVERGPGKVTSVEEWGKRGVYEGVTLPSGAQVSIRLPNVPQMVKTGALPNELLASALKHQAATEEASLTKESLEETYDFIRSIVPLTVVEPEVTPEDVDNGLLPSEDLEMIAAFANRTTDMDALGHHLGGLDNVKSFREARGIFRFDEDLDSL